MIRARDLAARPPVTATAAARAAWIDDLRGQDPEDGVWPELLAEQDPLFAGLSANDAVRLRAHVLGGFGERPPPGILPFIREDLTYSRDPRAVAAAAVALRPFDLPDAAELLVEALARILPRDDIVAVGRFAEPSPCCAATAASEVLTTLAGLGVRASAQRSAIEGLAAWPTLGGPVAAAAARALAQIPEAAPPPCCRQAAGPSAKPDMPRRSVAALAGLQLQDQDGAACAFGETFAGAPSLIGFFYTRCMNPAKCSLTISRLGALRREIAALDPGLAVNIAGVTYDPDYDAPARLRAFGEPRGFSFDPRTKLLRTAGAFEPLRQAFELGVGFGPATVNAHRLDTVILDGDLVVRDHIVRSEWDVVELAARLRELAQAPASAGRS
ncbi:MAG TPA: SCO family protein [Phenylobacterium sp.]|jgi:cytochrome oxidase Cu insertion factor (SCO1/SenC/PrrC family)|uniref:SCO family protein n=1 Tax=Phenylobacterium sp. TaxID=1871053 RepID=UPI002B9B1DF0|nr:SCO family protein [Phenylobacterium sp.]HXA37571.1 SCO family protein [Phenylobacterium sp.]